MMTTETFTGD